MYTAFAVACIALFVEQLDTDALRTRSHPVVADCVCDQVARQTDCQVSTRHRLSCLGGPQRPGRLLTFHHSSSGAAHTDFYIACLMHHILFPCKCTLCQRTMHMCGLSLLTRPQASLHVHTPSLRNEGEKIQSHPTEIQETQTRICTSADAISAVYSSRI